MVDVSVTCPTAATYLLAAARVDGSAAARRDTAKKAKYAQDGAGGYAFVPLSVETHGQWGKPAMQCWNLCMVVDSNSYVRNT